MAAMVSMAAVYREQAEGRSRAKMVRIILYTSKSFGMPGVLGSSLRERGTRDASWHALGRAITHTVACHGSRLEGGSRGKQSNRDITQNGTHYCVSKHMFWHAMGGGVQCRALELWFVCVMHCILQTAHTRRVSVSVGGSEG